MQDGGSPRVLIVSNGHGEDVLGVVLAKALIERGVTVHAFPVVGEGHSYHRAEIPVVGVQQRMPSGGFLRQGWRALFADVRAGFVSLTVRQIRALRRLAKDYDWAVAMGDVYPLWLCGRQLRIPFVFVPTAKSDYIRPHLKVEVTWMRRWPAAVFPRDAKTAESLSAQGVRATYVGNLMMDALSRTEDPLPGSGPLVGILPGSRLEAYDNALLQLRAVQLLPVGYRYAVALASELDEQHLASKAGAYGWTWDQDETKGVAGLLGFLRSGTKEVGVYKGRFADILHEASVILGMAGTANEQAAGMGKPVITCAGKGPQFTEKFVAAQNRLLGDSVLVTDSTPRALAAGVMKVLQDPDLYERMAATGRERMGEPGAAQRMAEFCVHLTELGLTAGERTAGNKVGRSGMP